MSLYDLRQKTRKLQNALSGYSNLENLIREATNTDPWGPTSKQKKQLLNWIMAYSNSGSASDFYDSYQSEEQAGSAEAQYDSEIGKFTANFIATRIEEYADLNAASKSYFSSIKKSLVIKGYEFVIISKCLQLYEYLLLNCYVRKHGRTEFDILQDLKFNLGTLVKLKHYTVTVAYDGLPLNHEKQIREMATHLIDLINDEEKLNMERAKFHPQDFEENQEVSRTHRRSSSSKKNMFYDEDQIDFNHAESLQLEEDQDPFGRSKISSLSNNVAKYVSNGTAAARRRSRSAGILGGAISLNPDEDPAQRRLPAGYSDANKYNFNDVHLHSSYENNVKYEDQPAMEEKEEEDDDDEFGDFQTTSMTFSSPETKRTSVSDTNHTDLLSLDNLDLTGSGVYHTQKPLESPISPITAKFGQPKTSAPTDNVLLALNDLKLSNGTKPVEPAPQQKKDLFNDLLCDFKTKAK